MEKYIAWKMKAAICDDTVEDAEFMEKHIKEYFMKKAFLMNVMYIRAVRHCGMKLRMVKRLICCFWILKCRN